MTTASAAALVAATTSPAQKDAATATARPAKSVIFLMGDGMGAATRDAIRYATVGPDGQLVMDSLPNTALVKTHPADPEDLVTDSAASATAYSTGVKTFNGAVGVDEEGNPVETILERARAAGKSTGLVTTGQITDASPAAFGAHVTNRSAQSEIARQYLEGSKPDVLLGGGEDWWLPAGNAGAFPDKPAEDPTEGSRSDQGNLIARARALGYGYVSSAAQLRRANGRKLLGLFANQEMFQQRPEGQGDIYDPVVSLPAMTDKALSTLGRDDDGFFLFVEEEGTDEFAHSNNGPKTIESGKQLDRAVQVALNFAATHPGTLIVTGADHETGGLAIEEVSGSDESGDGISAEDAPLPVADTDFDMTLDWTTSGHTAVDVPFTAAGRGSAAFRGTIDNTDVHRAFADAFGFDEDDS